MNTISAAPAFGCLTSGSLPLPTMNSKSLNLKDAVRDARGNINEIRMLLKGDMNTAIKLFSEVEKEGDAVTQIQLSHALVGMEKGADHTKDFSSLVVEDLETFTYYPTEFSFLKSAYDLLDRARGVKSEWLITKRRAEETFRLAASQGYLPAFLELKSYEWRWNLNSYGFAVQLRPFVGKGDRQLDFSFGHALMGGCELGSELYYEGLYWMNQSCGIPVKYPEIRSGKQQSFEECSHYYITMGEVRGSFYKYDGFLYFVEGPLVVAPSKGEWETYLKEKLEHVKIAPAESYVFKYDPDQIKSLLNEHKLEFIFTSSFLESPSGRLHRIKGKETHGFYICGIRIKSKDYNCEISVIQEEQIFKIHQTFEDSDIQPIIDFIENVMTRTGSYHSTICWLEQIRNCSLFSSVG